MVAQLDEGLDYTMCKAATHGPPTWERGTASRASALPDYFVMMGSSY